MPSSVCTSRPNSPPAVADIVPAVQRAPKVSRLFIQSLSPLAPFHNSIIPDFTFHTVARACKRAMHVSLDCGGAPENPGTLQACMDLCHSQLRLVQTGVSGNPDLNGLELAGADSSLFAQCLHNAMCTALQRLTLACNPANKIFVPLLGALDRFPCVSHLSLACKVGNCSGNWGLTECLKSLKQLRELHLHLSQGVCRPCVQEQKGAVRVRLQGAEGVSDNLCWGKNDIMSAPTSVQPLRHCHN